MRARKALGLAAWSILMAMVLVAAARPVRHTTRHAAPRAQVAMPVAELPPGAGHDIAARSCLMCHSSMLIAQQAKDSTGWEKTLALMEKWGAPVSGATQDTLRTYLLDHFGPRAAH